MDEWNELCPNCTEGQFDLLWHREGVEKLHCLDCNYTFELCSIWYVIEDTIQTRVGSFKAASARLARRKPGDKHDDRKKNRATTQ
jgi:Zn ribbon nucleic-acid-binding protein